MLEIILLCATYVWTPSEGPVDHYEVWLDGAPYATLMPVVEPTVEICVTDDLPHTVTVRAFDAAGNFGEMSEPSLERVIETFLPSAPLPVPVRADLNSNGVVGFSDFGLLLQMFGACNHQFQEVPCS